MRLQTGSVNQPQWRQCGSQSPRRGTNSVINNAAVCGACRVLSLSAPRDAHALDTCFLIRHGTHRLLGGTSEHRVSCVVCLTVNAAER
ncbi:hypothetical protein GN956_G7331 [Arapaima gigas]